MVRKGKEAAREKPEGELLVTAQESRYALDAVDAPESKEVLVKDMSISIGQQDILRNTDLHLHEGRHFVLAGRNGTGKSKASSAHSKPAILRAIGTNRVPSIPLNLRILLLGQMDQQDFIRGETREETLSNAAGASVGDVIDMSALLIDDSAEKTADCTVLESVLRAHKRVVRLQQEHAALSSSIDNAADPQSVVTAFRRVSHQRLLLQLAEQRLIATRRSGARGKNSRYRLIDLENQAKDSQAGLTAKLDQLTPEIVAEETKAANDLLGDISDELGLLDAASAPSLARRVLLGLGFTEERINQPVSQLSGGWRTVCSLACVLCQSTDVLLLDEPTNFLDVPSIIWLQNFIIEQLEDTTVVVVTHDRAFADAVADELLVLRNHTLERFRGGLSNYELQRRRHAKWMAKMKEAQTRQNEKLNESLDNSAKIARKAGDDKKLKQVAGRKKKIEERSGLQVSAKGTRFKLNRDMPTYSTTIRMGIEVRKFDPLPRIVVPSEPVDLRFPGPLISLENVSFRYKGSKTDVFSEVNLTISQAERVGLVGLNGSGKSTLVEMIVNEASHEHKPRIGSITRHPRVHIGRFSQGAIQRVSNEPSASSTSALAYLSRQLGATTHAGSSSSDTISEQEARGLLGGLGLSGKSVSDVPISQLSGGQLVRLALATLLWPAPPHLLILDEVTTHLDADTIVALIEALRSCKAALLVVSHDRFFMKGIVEGESGARGAATDEDEEDDDSEEEEENGAVKGVVYRLRRGRLMKLEGGMDQYEELAAKSSRKLAKA